MPAYRNCSEYEENRYVLWIRYIAFFILHKKTTLCPNRNIGFVSNLRKLNPVWIQLPFSVYLDSLTDEKMTLSNASQNTPELRRTLPGVFT